MIDLANLAEMSEFQATALAEVIAHDVWDAREGRSVDWADLGVTTQAAQRETARRHIDALARFLATG